MIYHEVSHLPSCKQTVRLGNHHMLYRQITKVTLLNWPLSLCSLQDLFAAVDHAGVDGPPGLTFVRLKTSVHVRAFRRYLCLMLAIFYVDYNRSMSAMCQMTTWRFPEIGVPLVIIHV